ncbi:Carbohydrate-selective porin, OprB family [Roseovarius albus]|uniref:Carbohydrate-selective porin, OprB family n=1 Tax=Roseovarius albus TaxID=1247867 RepID=A0A1X6Y7T2_9RHOB|nr:carbohydrate porin [Roseovarius albus]SLN13521.1 Carbohydrate-selective porin, OprB family [Roseovarius albus]
MRYSTFRLAFSTAVVAICFLFPGATVAQGLGGPSSVRADLEPGDGLTDPQYRSDFPRNIAPRWFAWKDGLAEQGFRFNIDYLALAQSSSSDLGEGTASGGIARFYGSWQGTNHGSLTFKLENRHAYGAVAPQFLGLDGGALAITGTAFNDGGTMLTNLFWTQRAENGSWTLQFGQIDVTDFTNVYGLVSPYTAFQNLAFNTNPTINAPNPGLAVAGSVKLGSNFYAIGTVADANADPTSPDGDVFSHGNLYKSLEIGYTSGFDRVYFDNIHLTLWHADAADDGSRLEDYGAAFSAAWFIDNQWMPFVRAGVSQGTTALYEKSVSAGIGYYGGNTDLAGLGLNWAEANGVPSSQTTAELFYRFSISPGLQITPSIQYIHNPRMNPGQSSIFIAGLRMRVVFWGHQGLSLLTCRFGNITSMKCKSGWL